MHALTTRERIHSAGLRLQRGPIHIGACEVGAYSATYKTAYRIGFNTLSQRSIPAIKLAAAFTRISLGVNTPSSPMN